MRAAVLWRKLSFGGSSVEACRFVERILTAVQTVCMQVRNVLAFLPERLSP
jgi:hypothetical protein